MRLHHPMAAAIALGMQLSYMSNVTAGTSTAEIVSNTLRAAPSCANYTVKGVCFWLKCKAFPPSCRVITNLRISHFSPEVVVSTWHEGVMHPWADYGKIVTAALTGPASGVVGMTIDSAGTNFSADRTDKNEIYRDADAIGNPANLAGAALSATARTAPGTAEIQSFIATAAADPVLGDRLTVPTEKRRTLVGLAEGVRRYESRASALQQVLQTQGASLNNAKLGASASGSSLFLNAPPESASGTNLMCPSTASAFQLYFHSYLDAFVWRSFVGAELLYPQSWIPGAQEIGNFPLNTWGSLYPRHGGVTQQNPVKGSAVIAQRVAHIVSQPRQPHVYTTLEKPGGYKYFNPMTVSPNDPRNSKWQRLYPNAQSSCQVFGTNDTVSPVSWGDGVSTAEQSYSWNLWRRLECCKAEGRYIGSVTY